MSDIRAAFRHRPQRRIAMWRRPACVPAGWRVVDFRGPGHMGRELPAPGTTVFGNLNNWGDSCEYRLPYNAELMYSSYLEQDADSFDIRQENGTLKVTLKDYPDYITGPYGIYTLYLRSGNIYTTIDFHVAMDR